METITAGSRRTLPPVPRSSPALPVSRDTRDTRPPVLHRPPVPRPPQAPEATTATPRDDHGQLFVAALRASAPRFASAAGATTAVIAEAVPPARHRRARCRVVLLTADGAEHELDFAGAAGRPTAEAAAAFTEDITTRLAAG
jgi:hypothetical protein